MKWKSAQGAAKAEAQQRLPEAKRAYFDAINEVSFKIFVVGDREHVAKFVELSNEKDLLCLDAMEFYRKMSERVVTSIGNQRMYGSTQIGLLVNDIREWVFDNKQELPLIREPNLDDLVVCPDDDAVYAVTRDLIRKAAGDVMNVLFLRQTLIKIGLENGYNKPAVPVVIYGMSDSEEEMEALKQVVEGRSFVVTADAKNSTPEGHLKVLSAIRADLVQHKQQ